MERRRTWEVSSVTLVEADWVVRKLHTDKTSEVEEVYPEMLKDTVGLSCFVDLETWGYYENIRYRSCCCKSLYGLGSFQNQTNRHLSDHQMSLFWGTDVFIWHWTDLDCNNSSNIQEHVDYFWFLA